MRQGFRALISHRQPVTRRSNVGLFCATQRRFLNLHEYQSKELMAKYDVRVQKGEVAESAEAVLPIAQKWVDQGADEIVVKAQIHAGGRGKGHFSNGFKGGVHWRTGPNRAQEVADLSKNMFNSSLITKQTGPEGQLCRKVLVHEGIGAAEKEFYFAILMDRAHNGPVIVASREGGMDIEEVAENRPEAIYTVPVDIKRGITDDITRDVASHLGFEGDALKDAQKQMTGLYNLFTATDATQVEINPLVVAQNGLVYCVDAKINFDANAAFRQKDIFALRDTSMEDPREVEASESDLNYIGLDGNIGCMVNGAGLAMATMDIIQHYGAKPANFLDVGGAANEKQVENAFRLLTADPHVKALLVNIFGGIMQCDVIARGIVNAAKTLELKIPLVVRLEGSNVEEGNRILSTSGLALITANNLDDAAQKAVQAIS